MKTRILFVDDERNILDATQRAFRVMKDEWEMEFAVSGEAALNSLATKSADVIVSDMRMPGMDGWELLAEVKKRHPETVRFLLSGYADPSSIMRAVGTAHQYLAKPCDSETIKAALAQTQVLRHLLSDIRLGKLVGQVDLLPSTPQAFQEILACVRRPNASLGDAARIIARDVAMTANILKLVNSAFFGARQSIAKIDRAVSFLGMDTLGSLVLGYGVFQSGVTINIPGFSLQELWQHSLQTATMAKTIATHLALSAIRTEEAFLVGLLHDVGKVVFATRNPANADAAASPQDVAAQMAAHHGEVGAYLLGLWGFPNSIVEAVAFHHTPSPTPDPTLSLPAIVHLADRLSRQSKAAGSSPSELEIEPWLMSALGPSRVSELSAAALGVIDSGESVR